MYKLIDDVSALTQVNIKILQKIADSAQESFLYQLQDMKEDEVKEVDIGIGIITVQRIENELIFNFNPSEYIYNHIYDKKSTLESRIEDKLAKKILSTYKELM